MTSKGPKLMCAAGHACCVQYRVLLFLIILNSKKKIYVQQQHAKILSVTKLEHHNLSCGQCCNTQEWTITPLWWPLDQTKTFFLNWTKH